MKNVEAWLGLYTFYYNFIQRHETSAKPASNPTRAAEYENLIELIEKPRA